MSLKKKLGLGVASAALGLSLVGGGTYAYFSDTATESATFAAGTLELSTKPTALTGLTNLKPGDWMNRSFELKNDGTLDISQILLSTNYTVTNKAGAVANTDDLGKHIRVEFLYNEDKSFLEELSPDKIIYRTTLYDLKNMTPDAVANNVFVRWLEEREGLKAGDSDKLHVKFKFIDQGDQNQFQGDSLALTWTFEGKQGAGESK
jgi:spore coat-associated protein N